MVMIKPTTVDQHWLNEQAAVHTNRLINNLRSVLSLKNHAIQSLWVYPTSTLVHTALSVPRYPVQLTLSMMRYMSTKHNQQHQNKISIQNSPSYLSRNIHIQKDVFIKAWNASASFTIITPLCVCYTAHSGQLLGLLMELDRRMHMQENPLDIHERALDFAQHALCTRLPPRDRKPL